MLILYNFIHYSHAIMTRFFMNKYCFQDFLRRVHKSPCKDVNVCVWECCAELMRWDQIPGNPRRWGCRAAAREWQEDISTYRAANLFSKEDNYHRTSFSSCFVRCGHSPADIAQSRHTSSCRKSWIPAELWRMSSVLHVYLSDLFSMDLWRM